MILFDSENADLDITSLITCLTDTPDASNPSLCQGLIFMGDGAKNLDGNGGIFELVITIGGQTLQPSTKKMLFDPEVRSSMKTPEFLVPANTEVLLRILSPNGADTDVDVTAYLYDVSLSAGASTTKKSVGGTLTPAGALSRALTAYRGFGGTLTSSGALARARIVYRSLGGALTPTGDLLSALYMIMSLGGELDFAGDLSATNPLWLLIDDTLTWMGEWDATYGYAIDDVVLYKTSDGNEWHVFISKIGHNVGNIPTSTAAAWRRLYQEKWL